MKQSNEFDAVIIGGSYAGLSAAMSLGRTLRSVLVIDDDKPCNRTAPHAHNFLTQDGQTPDVIRQTGKAQVAAYPTVSFHQALATSITQFDGRFAVATSSGESFSGRKLILATGLKDALPGIPGFAACWGKSVVHCPYCHGYEAKGQQTAILADGDPAMHYARLVSQLTDRLVLCTNGPSTLTLPQRGLMENNGISIVETPIERIAHNDGYVQELVFSDGNALAVGAVYARPPVSQHGIVAGLGCTLTAQGLVQTDAMQQTSIPGVFACGDNTNFSRSVAASVASGSAAGAFVNSELCTEAFDGI